MFISQHDKDKHGEKRSHFATSARAEAKSEETPSRRRVTAKLQGAQPQGYDTRNRIPITKLPAGLTPDPGEERWFVTRPDRRGAQRAFRQTRHAYCEQVNR
jgi:hypothetical protein